MKESRSAGPVSVVCSVVYCSSVNILSVIMTIISNYISAVNSYSRAPVSPGRRSDQLGGPTSTDWE